MKQTIIFSPDITKTKIVPKKNTVKEPKSENKPNNLRKSRTKDLQEPRSEETQRKLQDSTTDVLLQPPEKQEPKSEARVREPLGLSPRKPKEKTRKRLNSRFRTQALIPYQIDRMPLTIVRIPLNRKSNSYTWKL